MSPRLLSALSLAISLSALGFTFFRSEPAEKKTARERPAPPVEEPISVDEELDAKISALEWVVSALGRRIETVETTISRGGLPAPMPHQSAKLSGDVGARVEALQKDVDALFAAGVLDTDHGRARVKEVFREMQDEIATDRFRAREEQREEQRKERFTRFAAEARLTTVQQRLEGVLDSEVTERRALFEKMQGGGGERGQALQELRALREKTDQAAREILPGDEYEKYQAMRRAEGGRQGGGRGGRMGEGQGRAGGRGGEERSRPQEGGRGRR